MNRYEKRRQKKLAQMAAKNANSGQASNTSEALGLRNDLNLAIKYHSAGNLAKAESLYRQILQSDPNHPVAMQLLGVVAHHMGKLDIAVDLIGKALAIAPDFAAAHSNLGNALRAQGKLDAAVSSHRKAIAIEPDLAEFHNNLGNTLFDQAKMDDAITSYRNALSIKPDYVEAHSNLCDLLEKTNNTEALRKAVVEALNICPENPSIALREGQLLKRDGKLSDARTVLETRGDGLTDLRSLTKRSQLLGDLCDRLGDTDAAFRYFKESNSYLKRSPDAKGIDAKHYLMEISNLAEQFTSDWIMNWQDVGGFDERSAPVFLVGFPRSGTTLLDTILRSHPAISVIEEQGAIKKVKEALEHLPGGYPDGLSKLSSSNFVELRNIYFAERNKHLEAGNNSTVIIDKFPLNIVDVGLIHRIFPEARFIFAQRHPCDCVLSCFMQYFELNRAMVNFLDLADAAHLYDKVMSLWQQYQSALPLEVHTVRYENIIGSFEETVAPVLDFLGLDWDESVKDYTKTARQRGRIDTPSYNQVTQPLYTRAAGRWEHYRSQMNPVLATLLPWAKRFGYDE